METEATASGETIARVLLELGFVPMLSLDPECIRSWHDDESGVAVRQYLDGRWFAWCGNRRVWNPSPAHLRRIVAAEVACAAAFLRAVIHGEGGIET